jgi:protein-L-isoaspartate(D-aspartate) O-methyltransferase
MDSRLARERMVATQIAARGVRDERVLRALRDVPREAFVPPALKHDAYEDRPLPIGEGQTISQPYIVAAMTVLLAPGPEDHVLDIGTGSGYQAAILAMLVRSVVSIERHASLAARAVETLASLGITNVDVIVGDGSDGYPVRAPYDRILVAAGAPDVPASLGNQLSDGGRLVMPVGPPAFQRLTVVDRRGGSLIRTDGEGCVFVPLVGRHGWPA